MTENGLGGWQRLPQLEATTPVLALVASADALWAGGVGGVARWDGAAWRPCAPPGVGPIAALTWAGSWLLAAGAAGIARSPDGGASWQPAVAPAGTRQLSALAASPRVAEDGTVLAAAIGEGIVRSADGGATWEAAAFGLHDYEVTSLLWGQGEAVLAGTAEGLYRSPNGGRAWRAAAPPAGNGPRAVAALAILADGTYVAALEDGEVWRSRDGGASWAVHGAAPPGTLATTLLAIGETLMLGTTQGVLRSTDEGRTWAAAAPVGGLIFSLAAAGESLYAGHAGGLLHGAEAGATWTPLAPPPLADYGRLLAMEGALLAVGPYSGLALLAPDGAWQVLVGPAPPLTAVAPAGSARLLAAGPAGLTLSVDGGATWEVVAPADPAWVPIHLTSGPDGVAWAGSAGGHLRRSAPGGVDWAPAGQIPDGRPLVALQAIREGLLAVTHDAAEALAYPWRSADGATWQSAPPVPAGWPIAATWGEPPMLAAGDTVYAALPDGRWRAVTLPVGGPALHATGAGQVAVVLTAGGLCLSTDSGLTWQETLPPPPQPPRALAIIAGTLFVLADGGQAYARRLG